MHVRLLGRSSSVWENASRYNYPSNDVRQTPFDSYAAQLASSGIAQSQNHVRALGCDFSHLRLQGYWYIFSNPSRERHTCRQTAAPATVGRMAAYFVALQYQCCPYLGSWVGEKWVNRLVSLDIVSLQVGP